MDYKEIEKRQYDAQQYILNSDLTISINPFKCAIKEPEKRFDMVVLCPFCLNTAILAKFKYEKGLRVCSYCGNKLMLSTLTEINDLNKFVKFVFDYRFNGFWSKICLDIKEDKKDDRFNMWNKRLHDLGLSLEFWDNYKRLKGE